MEFLDRLGELRRLDRAVRSPAPFAAIWGRRRVGKSRLLIEWSRRYDGLYTVADQSAPPVQRRYLAAERFPGFRGRRVPGLAVVLPAPVRRRGGPRAGRDRSSSTSCRI